MQNYVKKIDSYSAILILYSTKSHSITFMRFRLDCIVIHGYIIGLAEASHACLSILVKFNTGFKTVSCFSMKSMQHFV